MIYSCTVCNQNKEVVIPKLEHTHNYGSQWGSDSSTHWHLCVCGSKEDIAAHSWDAGQVSVEATEESTGLKIYTCTICGEEREIALPKLPHSHKYSSEWKYDETGHWHECHCKDRKDFATHTSSGPATEDVAEVCTVCKYMIAPELDHVHIYNVKIAGSDKFSQLIEFGIGAAENLKYNERKIGKRIHKWEKNQKIKRKESCLFIQD